MKYIRQFMIILLFCFCGEWLKHLLPFKIPASIYGLVLLFAALECGLLSLSAIEETGKFLIEIMPLLFIPAGVGLMEAWDALRPICMPIIIIILLSTVIVMAVSGRVTQFFMRTGRRIFK